MFRSRFPGSVYLRISEFHNLRPLVNFVDDQLAKIGDRTGKRCPTQVGWSRLHPFHPFVPSVIREFREAYPLVSLTLEECHSNELLEHLRNERIDAAFIRTPPTDPQGLMVNSLLDEKLVVALPSEHVLAQNNGGSDAALSLKALAGETFIIQGSQYGLGLYASVVAACHAAGFKPQLGQEATRLASTLNLVAVGLGISVVPASMQRMHMNGVSYRRLKGSNQLKAPLILASRRGDPSAVVRQFLSLVKKTARSFNTNQS